MAEKIILEGSVDPKLIRDVATLADGLRRTGEEGERAGRTALGSSFGQLRAQIGEAGERAQSFGRGMAEVTGILGGTTAAAVAGAVAFGRLAAAGDTNVRAFAGVRGGFAAISRETAGTVTALAAYRAQQTLVNSGLRVSGEELAAVSRHAREHRDVTKSVEEAVQELTEALRGGEAEGLRKYGIAVEQGASRAQTFERALDQMRRSAEGAQPAVRDLDESMNALESGAHDATSGFATLISTSLGLDGVVRNLSTDIRRLGDDLTELNARRAQAARSQADEAERARLLEDVRRNRTAIAQTLREQGLSAELLPGTDLSLNRLSTAQLTEAAGTLASIRAESEGQRSTTAEDIRIGPNGLTGPRSIENIATGLGANDAERALSSLQGARGASGAAARDAARQMLETRLGTFLGSIRQALNPDEAPRDSAAPPPPAATPDRPAAAAAGPTGPTSLDAQLADVEANIARMGTLTADLRDRAYGDAEGAAERLRALQEQQIALIQQIASGARSGENDNARAIRQAAAGTRVAELERAARAPLDAEARLNAEKEAANTEANRLYARQQFQRSDEGQSIARDNSLRGLRRDALRSRDRARVGQQATLADLRDPAVQAEGEADRALSTQVERERAQTDERLRVQESFTEQWERLHRRQASATTAFTESASGAIGKFGDAFGKHLNLIIAGQESIGDGVLNMVGEVVTGIGQEAIVKAAMETAEGIAAAAGVLTAPLAPGHFAAAAAFGAVGVAALGAGAILGAARGGGGGASAPVAPALPPPTQADAAPQGQSITIVYGSGILGSPRDLARHVRDVLDEGEQAGVRLPARVVERAA